MLPSHPKNTASLAQHPVHQHLPRHPQIVKPSSTDGNEYVYKSEHGGVGDGDGEK